MEFREMRKGESDWRNGVSATAYAQERPESALHFSDYFASDVPLSQPFRQRRFSPPPRRDQRGLVEEFILEFESGGNNSDVTRGDLFTHIKDIKKEMQEPTRVSKALDKTPSVNQNS